MKLYPRAGIYYVRFWRRGREIRRSTGCTTEKQARKVADGLQREITLGRFAPEWERTTYQAMAEALERQYRQDGLRSMRALKARLKHLRWFEGRRPNEITKEVIGRYVEMRLDMGAANGTVNRELAALSGMFRALDIPKPRIPRLKENNVRQGFVQWGEFIAIRGELPAKLRGLVTVLYVTGWRFGAVTNLQWRDITAEAIRVRKEFSKNAKALEFPLVGELAAAIKEARRTRVPGPYVFQHGQRAYRDIRISWKAACARAGFPGLLMHDLCRSAIRNMVRTDGITEHMAMELAGRKTRSILDRYDIVSAQDRKEAATRLSAYLDSQRRGSKVRPIKR